MYAYVLRVIKMNYGGSQTGNYANESRQKECPTKSLKDKCLLSTVSLAYAVQVPED